MPVELRVPEAGESIREVQVGEWLKADGDFVQRDEVVVEVETDKAAMELPAPATGRLSIRKPKGEIVPVGEVLAVIDETAGEPGGPPPGGTSAPGISVPDGPPARGRAGSPAIVHATQRELVLKEDVQRAAVDGREVGAGFYEAGAPGSQSPALTNVVRAPTPPVPAAPLVPPVPAAPPATTAQPAPTITAVPKIPERRPKPTASLGPREEEAVPMSMLRRRVAQRLVESQQTAAMLTTFNEVDCAAMSQFRKEHNDAFEKKYGIRLGLMSFFVKASIDALKLYPQVNAEVRGHDIVYKNYYDIGVAVATDRGLVVPVLRNAELMSFAQVEQAIADLAGRARENKLTLEELQGGTFTITNGGVFGSLLSTPILNPPQSGILGLHTIQDRPVVRDGRIVVRPMMYVALTYDHRIVDGREAVGFLRRIKECIESPARMLLEA